ncbi:Connector enhancer of kinase suppressor of ras 2 [Portunus trituberculatus]|uniref:Connector enhancer of kinase suppressor of ras 2 n=1 Tax=Portunus trituberculatus TaxID=210409 RepID=A0A5B7DXH5_PORTR|nr:Connector enhancer of kinase suppressor of ras 2 [Portunus trituberculatus]
MAYVNVAEWNPYQVSEWLKGLDEVILPYVRHFASNQVDGKRLLQLSADTLPALRVTKVGHQEIILQAVDLLRNIHYHLNQENVQHLALRLSSKARSVCSELRYAAIAARTGGGSAGEEEDGEEEEEEAGQLRGMRKKQESVSTAVIGGVADVLSAVKCLVYWLNRQPFEGQERYDNIKKNLVELSIGLATIAQRDKFAENQASLILHICEKLVTKSDIIIQVSLYERKNSAECGQKFKSGITYYW